MKKIVIWSAVIIIIVVLLGFICASVASRRIEYDIMDEETVNNLILAELTAYKNKKCYKGMGFQDYTKYCEYCYMDNVLNLLDKSSYLKKVTSDDISTVVNYFENFKKWIEHEDFRRNYNFDKEFVSEGDYFYIDNNYSNENFDYNPEKYPTYNAYWFDRETLTMYFIHNGV